MQNIKNFKSYIPAEDKQDLLNLGVNFLSSEDGKDWYDSQKDFKEKTLKITYDPVSKVIISASYDVSSLFPENLSVAEVEDTPKGFPTSVPFDSFVYDEKKGKISSRSYTSDELKEQASSKKRYLIAEAMTLINPLKFAVDLSIATDEEKSKLETLQKYVVDLNRIEQQDSYPKKINWPEIPKT